MVGDRDRPEPPVARGLEQPLDRRRAVVRVIGVHVQVDVDQPPRGQPAAHGRASGAVTARRDAPVQVLELVRDARPLELGVQAHDPRAELVAQPAVVNQASDLGGQRVGVARLEEQAAVAVGERLLVLRQACRDRYRAAGHRPERELRCRRDPRGGRHHDVGAGDVLRL